jgi:endoglucanase
VTPLQPKRYINRRVTTLVAAVSTAAMLLADAAKVKTQKTALPEEDVKRVVKYFEATMKSPYLAQDCEPTSYPNWEALPVKKCLYTVSDGDGIKKSATVILLLPSPQQLARWVVHACVEVKGNASAQCTDKLSKRIHGQSGGQFPVAGLVFEDLLPTDKHDGIHEMYPFRDGVTVRVDGVRNQSTMQPTAKQIDAALVGEVKGSGIYARVQGTTREEYKNNGGTADVGDSKQRKLSWLAVSRDEFKAAWGSERNELLIAWARSNVK